VRAIVGVIAADDARTVPLRPLALALAVLLLTGAAAAPAAAQSLIWQRYLDAAIAAAEAGRLEDAEGLLRRRGTPPRS